MAEQSLVERSTPFLNNLDQWMKELPELTIQSVLSERVDQVAIISVDMIEGFCSAGALSSPRVAEIIQPIVNLFDRAWAAGVRHFLLTQDTHEPDAVEFAQFPPHCVRGTAEAETVQAIKALPFFNAFRLLEKNSIASGLETGLESWIEEHPEVDTFVVVGDCTDLCTYQLAMYLRLDANARQLSRRVVVPANCVETYDRPVEVAKIQGGYPHPGDLMHAIFLYHMALNGVEVVSSLT